MVVPEPTLKALAASLTVVLVAWLGVDTLWSLMEGWSRLAARAHEASTFAQLREAGDAYAKVLGTSAARVLVLAVGTLAGHTVGQATARVRALPGFASAAVRWEAQSGGVGALGVGAQEALVAAVETVEWVAATPGAALVVVHQKKGGGRCSGTGVATSRWCWAMVSAGICLKASPWRTSPSKIPWATSSSRR